MKALKTKYFTKQREETQLIWLLPNLAFLTQNKSHVVNNSACLWGRW